MKSFAVALLFLFVTHGLKAMDICDEIANAIRSGDSKQIALYFGSSVDLAILNQEDVYSRAQAELIVKDFLNKNTPRSFNVLHKGSSKEGTQYAVGQLTAINGKSFRVSYFVKLTAGKYLVRELRFETE